MESYYLFVINDIVILVCVVSVGVEAVLPHHPLPPQGQPRVQAPHRVLHLQTRV